MWLESIAIRILNRQRRVPAKPASGLRLGQGETLLTKEQGPFSLPLKPAHHSFISGRTGSGKTTLLLRIMAEYHKAGIPFLFIDLHGHATNDLLALFGTDGTNS